MEAINWSGVGHAEYAAALGLSRHACIGRDRLEQSGNETDWRSLLHPSARAQSSSAANCARRKLNLQRRVGAGKISRSPHSPRSTRRLSAAGRNPNPFSAVTRLGDVARALSKRQRATSSRKPLLEHLPREHVLLDVEDEGVCRLLRPLHPIGQSATEILDGPSEQRPNAPALGIVTQCDSTNHNQSRHRGSTKVALKAPPPGPLSNAAPIDDMVTPASSNTRSIPQRRTRTFSLCFSRGEAKVHDPGTKFFRQIQLGARSRLTSRRHDQRLR